MTVATNLQTAMAYRTGEPDIECRYPVIIGADRVIGRAYRWHRDWLVIASTGEHNLRRPPQRAPRASTWPPPTSPRSTPPVASPRRPWSKSSPRHLSRSLARCVCYTPGCQPRTGT